VCRPSQYEYEAATSFAGKRKQQMAKAAAKLTTAIGISWLSMMQSRGE